MKKLFLFVSFLGGMLLYSISPANAAWEKIKEEPQGTYYIDNSSYKCTCTGADTMYFKVKQVPTFSNAKYIINNMKISNKGSERGWVYNYATRYYNSGRVEDMQLPPVHVRDFVGSGNALDNALKKIFYYCDSYCKGK